MSVYIVMLGPPGAGKGTQAAVLASKLAIPHISTGDLFRHHMREKSELGRLARSFIDRGELVPDEVTIAMVRERLTRADCSGGAILDGFPRTPAQAEALEQMLAAVCNGCVRLVPFVTAPEATLVDRLAGRLTCRAQGHVYHRRLNPPRAAGRCDQDGSELYQRDDDREETVRRRIQVYSEQTAPLVDYYRAKGMLVEINGDRPIEDVTADLMAAVRAG
jgi:adenylate kinase